MDRLKWLVVIGALALLLGVVEAGPAAAAKGGNNDSASACQNGGWQILIAQTGEVFKNQGDCVNDGAQGAASFGTYGYQACKAIPDASYMQVDSGLWTCIYTPDGTPPNDPNTQSLQTACRNDDGHFRLLHHEGSAWLVECAS